MFILFAVVKLQEIMKRNTDFLFMRTTEWLWMLCTMMHLPICGFLDKFFGWPQIYRNIYWNIYDWVDIHGQPLDHCGPILIEQKLLSFWTYFIMNNTVYTRNMLMIWHATQQISISRTLHTCRPKANSLLCLLAYNVCWSIMSVGLQCLLAY